MSYVWVRFNTVYMGRKLNLLNLNLLSAFGGGSGTYPTSQAKLDFDLHNLLMNASLRVLLDEIDTF